MTSPMALAVPPFQYSGGSGFSHTQRSKRSWMNVSQSRPDSVRSPAGEPQGPVPSSSPGAIAASPTKITFQRPFS